MHIWGDDWFEANGKDFNNAIGYFYNFIRKWGRIKAYTKEKYGTHRTNTWLWDGGLHYFLYRSFIRIENKFIYWKLDRFVIQPFTKYTGIRWLVIQYQLFIWNLATQIVCKKYPNIIDEFVMDMDLYDAVKPSIFGKVNGKIIHKKYWKVL